MPVGIVGSAHLAANPARCCGGPGLAADKRSGVDPFVIALAMVNQGTVVTEENPCAGGVLLPSPPCQRQSKTDDFRYKSTPGSGGSSRSVRR
jgi:hypothetical protein